jgi:hypothetical protein
MTKKRNPLPPAIDVYLDWAVTAWESVSVEIIVNSFKAWQVFQDF